MIPVLLFTCVLHAQVTTIKLPKIRYQEGFLSTKWELGDKDVKPADIRLHLEKNNQEAFYQWRRADALDVQTVIWSLLCAGGAVGGVLLKDDKPKLVALGGCVLFGTIGITTGLVAGSKRKKAVTLYNRSAGY